VLAARRAGADDATTKPYISTAAFKDAGPHGLSLYYLSLNNGLQGVCIIAHLVCVSAYSDYLSETVLVKPLYHLDYVLTQVSTICSRTAYYGYGSVPASTATG
jgi:hypothetical protein